MTVGQLLRTVLYAFIVFGYVISIIFFTTPAAIADSTGLIKFGVVVFTTSSAVLFAFVLCKLDMKIFK